MISQHVIPGMVKVLQNSPELKKLIIHTVDRGNVWPIPEEYIDTYLDSHGLNSDQCTRVFKNISRKNVESKHVASFMKLVLKTTKTLDKMVVRLEGYLKERGFEELSQMVPVLLTHNNNIFVVLSSTKKKNDS